MLEFSNLINLLYKLINIKAKGWFDMNIVVLGGAAQMAQPAVKYLIEKEEIKQIIIADLNLQLVKKIADELGSKIIPKSVDVTNEEQLKNVITDADLVLNFIGPYFKFGTKVLETVIEAGINYIDICDDHDATMDAMELNERAKGKGVTALIGMGASPGITNVLARLASDELDSVAEINTYWLVGKTGVGGFGAMQHMFHIIDGEVPVCKRGKLDYIPPFQEATAKKVNFGDPVGEVTLYPVGHPEPVTLSQSIPGVQTVTNYGALLPAHMNLLYKTLVDFGFTREEPILFKGEEVSPLEFLLALFEHESKRNPNKFSVGDKPLGASRIEVIGSKNGEQTSYTFTRSGHYTMANSTSLPTAVAAYLMLTGEVDTTGVIPPESIEPKKLLLPLKETHFFGDGRDFQLVRKIGNTSTPMHLFDLDVFSK